MEEGGAARIFTERRWHSDSWGEEEICLLLSLSLLSSWPMGDEIFPCEGDELEVGREEVSSRTGNGYCTVLILKGCSFMVDLGGRGWC